MQCIWELSNRKQVNAAIVSQPINPLGFSQTVNNLNKPISWREVNSIGRAQHSLTFNHTPSNSNGRVNTDKRSFSPVSPSLSPPLGLSAHYFKLSRVFICRDGDVGLSSAFPSRAVYIREPIWLYKTELRKGGGSQPSRGDMDAILPSRVQRPLPGARSRYSNDGCKWNCWYLDCFILVS